jgi:hypothetical protein
MSFILFSLYSEPKNAAKEVERGGARQRWARQEEELLLFQQGAHNFFKFSYIL